MFTPEQTTREVDFVVEKLGLKPGHAVLDLCCGQGRHAVELARRGFRVTGLDLSEYLLARGRQQEAKSDVHVRWVLSDMRRIPFKEEFDAVINMFTAFGYLEDDDQNLMVLKAVSASLKAGGGFLLDTRNRESDVRNYRPNFWWKLEDGTLILAENRLDWMRGVIETAETLIHPDGRRESSSFAVRMYTLAELAAMCRSAGLRITAAYGDFSGADYGLDTQRLILTARKESEPST